MKRADYAITVLAIYWAGYLGYLLGAHHEPAFWYQLLAASPLIVACIPTKADP